jgi:cytochrome c-type biogenesis protein CcmF
MSASSRYRQSLSLKPQMVMMAIALSAFLWPLPFQIWARVGLALFIWVVLQTGYDLSKNAVTIKRVSMHLAHMGFAVFILGIAISQTMGVEQERRLSPGDHFAMAGSSVQLNRFDDVFGPNYEGVRATLWVSTPGHEPMILKPEKRYYTFRGIAISETAIEGNLMRDWYIALGEPLADNSAFTINPGCGWCGWAV